MPYAVLGRYTDENLMLRIVDVDMRIRAYFGKDLKKVTKDCDGVSLGYTSGTGGRHGCQAEPIGGSTRVNQHFLNNPDLQIDAIDVLCEVVMAAFKYHVWFKKLMAYYDLEEFKERKKALLPGIPFTNAWWSCDSRSCNKHIDNDANGVALVLSH
jgi:hypothetical protein